MRVWTRRTALPVLFLAALALTQAGSSAAERGATRGGHVPTVIVNGKLVPVQITATGPPGRIVVWGDGRGENGATTRGPIPPSCLPDVRLMLAGDHTGDTVAATAFCGGTNASTQVTLGRGGGFLSGHAGPGSLGTGAASCAVAFGPLAEDAGWIAVCKFLPG